MLVLSRKIGEKVRIGDLVTLTVLHYRRGRIRLGFDAPEAVHIVREEITSTLRPLIRPGCHRQGMPAKR
jgi:carbon storage regulator